MLGSKPSRDAGNPPVIMLAQAVRIERTWASFRATLGYQQPTPEEIWRAVKESNPARSVLETNPRPAPNPKWRMTGHSKTIPLRIQLGFRPVPAPWLVCHPRWRRQQESNLHGLGRPSRGSGPISTPLRVSKDGGRRSIETQERKPLICFRGSDRLPACYTFQHSYVPVRAYFARRDSGVYLKRL